MVASRVVGSEGDPLIGQVLDGRYRVDRFVGGGGMGRVYEAVKLDLGRRVALKVLIPELARQPMILERFRREAQAAGVLGNPHIVEVTEFVQPEDGPPFLVMEHLVGASLTEVLESEGALAIGRARRIAVQLLDGLQEAHDAGIIHRDLKPDNVFLRSLADGEEMVKLLDFGVAKLTEAPMGGPQLTAVGALVGTPRFAAPEQLRGGAVDARTDIYGAGVLLYGMLTGRPPFGGSVQELIHGVLNDEAPDVRIANPMIEPQLAAIVQRAMAKRPEHRFASAEEMLNALGGRRAKAGRIGQRVADVRRAAEAQEASRKKRPWLRGALIALAVLFGLGLAGATGVLGYQLSGVLGSDDDDEDTIVDVSGVDVAPLPVAPMGGAGSCDALIRAACEQCPERCADVRARVDALRGDGTDASMITSVEGWCRVSLSSGEACRATPTAAAALPTPAPFSGRAARGELTRGDWQRPDGSYVDRYTLSLTEGAGLEITLSGDELDPHLVLYAPSGRIVGAGHAGQGLRAKIAYLPTEDGPHVLEVAGAAGQVADYDLSVNWDYEPHRATQEPRNPRPRPTLTPVETHGGGGQMVPAWPQ